MSTIKGLEYVEICCLYCGGGAGESHDTTHIRTIWANQFGRDVRYECAECSSWTEYIAKYSPWDLTVELILCEGARLAMSEIPF